MYCVNCGTKLEEQWKICPQCGKEISIRGEEKIVEPIKKTCSKCGNVLEEEWVKCPFCGRIADDEKVSDEKNDIKDKQKNIDNTYIHTSTTVQEEKGENSKTNIKSKKTVISMVVAIILIIGIVGVILFLTSNDSSDKQPVREQTEVKTLDEVGGYVAWVESEYATKIRTDIVVTLPVTQRKDNTYAVQILTSLGDIIFIMQEDESPATEWEWLMNAVPDYEGGDIATFQATLSLTGYTVMENKAYPRFIAEDIKSYTMQQVEEIPNGEYVESDLSYDLYEDAENGLLYSNEDGQITDKEGNVIPEYMELIVLENGAISTGTHIAEGLFADENGKLYVEMPGEVTEEVDYIDNLINDWGYVNNNSLRYIFFTHREGDMLYFGIYDENDIDILRNCPAKIIDSTTFVYSEPDYGCELTIKIQDEYSFEVSGTFPFDDFVEGLYFINAG